MAGGLVRVRSQATQFRRAMSTGSDTKSAFLNNTVVHRQHHGL